MSGTDKRSDVALPYYRWYIKDFRGSRRVQQLDWKARGCYRELLDECWLTGFIPDDLVALAAICGAPLGNFERVWKQLKDLFVPVENMDPFFLTSPRLEVERTREDRKRVQASIAGKVSARNRNARQRPLNDRYIAVKAEQSSSMDERSLALDDARPLVIDPDAACAECGSKGSAFAAGIHKPGCSLAPRELPRVSRVGAE